MNLELGWRQFDLVADLTALINICPLFVPSHLIALCLPLQYTHTSSHSDM